MNANGLVSKLNEYLRWMTRLAGLNALFLIGMLAGVVLFGLFPSIYASLGLAKKWFSGNTAVPLWRTYWQLYKQEWKTANLTGMLLSITGGILYINYLLLKSVEGSIFFLVPFAFIALVFLFGLVVLWVFPLMVYYKASLQQHMKNAFILGLTKIHLSFGMAVVWFAVGYYSLKLPSLIPFFSFALLFLGWMWLAYQVLAKIRTNPTAHKKAV
ncbi:MAG: YesL family protein [Bacillota bacterium]